MVHYLILIFPLTLYAFTMEFTVGFFTFWNALYLIIGSAFWAYASNYDPVLRVFSGKKYKIGLAFIITCWPLMLAMASCAEKRSSPNRSPR